MRTETTQWRNRNNTQNNTRNNGTHNNVTPSTVVTKLAQGNSWVDDESSKDVIVTEYSPNIQPNAPSWCHWYYCQHCKLMISWFKRKYFAAARWVCRHNELNMYIKKKKWVKRLTYCILMFFFKYCFTALHTSECLQKTVVKLAMVYSQFEYLL